MKQLDFTREEEKAGQMSDDELRFAMKDASEAAKADKLNEGFYHDQMSVYAIELKSREGVRAHGHGMGWIG